MKKVFSLIFISIFLGGAMHSQKNDLKIMSFNIRMDRAPDGINQWSNRKEWVAELIKFYDIDILGCQEVTANQLHDLQNRLSEYEFVGVGRDDGKEAGEFSPLFFRKERFEMLATQTFWLSQTPHLVSKGWDANYFRIATWAELIDKNSRDTFFVFNTHFDHIAVEARKHSVVLLREKVQQIAGNRLAFITGDFNFSEQTEYYKSITKDSAQLIMFFDSHKLAQSTYGPSWTFQGFGQVPLKEREKIDFIFTTQPSQIKVKQSAIVSEQRDSIFPSDHFPLFIEIGY